MKRVNLKLIVAIVAVALLSIAVALFIKLSSKRNVVANINATTITQGESIIFKDETKNAESWLWEFGDGYKVSVREGSYIPPKAGTYTLRLVVDDKLVKQFDNIVVKEPEKKEDDSHPSIFIDAPQTGQTKEPVQFWGKGIAEVFQWYFNSRVNSLGKVELLGRLGSLEQNPTFAFDKAGMYDVTLITEEPADTTFCRIRIINPPDFVSSLKDSAQNDIKIYLQAIASRYEYYELTGRESMNARYNYIKNKYFGSDPHMLITVNDNENYQFYDYCQMLHSTGIYYQTIIDEVNVEIAKDSDLITKVEVKQHNIK